MKLLILGLSLLFSSCNKDKDVPATRSYKMGFQNSAPRFDSFDLFIQSLNIWTKRADAAIISTEVPWKALLGGESPEQYVTNQFKNLAEFYRSKNFELWVYIDPQNGLDRTLDAAELVAAGKSIAQNDMQAIYKRFTIVMDSILKPEHIGLALETNLIRVASPPLIYNGIKRAASEAASELKLKNSKAKLSISVQVEQTWGKFTRNSYQGIEQDLNDFPFAEELGLSSYPYLFFNTPKDIPEDYYSRLFKEKKMPVFVSEGGWSSESVTTPDRSFVSSTQLQKEYIQREEQLLNSVNASAIFQLVFTDIDLAHLPAGVSTNINYFAYLGLADKNLQPKLSLTAWDEIFEKPLK